MSTVTALAALAALAGLVHHHLREDRPGRLFRLEQFRPAAPLAGILGTGTGPGERPDSGMRPSEKPQSSTSVLD